MTTIEEIKADLTKLKAGGSHIDPSGGTWRDRCAFLLAEVERSQTRLASTDAHVAFVADERERFAVQREEWRARSIANEDRAEKAERERDNEAKTATISQRLCDEWRARAEQAERERDDVEADFARLRQLADIAIAQRDQWKALAESRQRDLDALQAIALEPSDLDALHRLVTRCASADHIDTAGAFWVRLDQASRAHAQKGGR